MLNSIKLSTIEMLATIHTSQRTRKDFYLYLVLQFLGLTTLVVTLGGNDAVIAVLYISTTTFIFGCCYEFLANIPGKKALKYLKEHHLWKRNAFDVL